MISKIKLQFCIFLMDYSEKQQQNWRSHSTQSRDERFTVDIPVNKILKAGKLFFLKNGCSVYTPDNIDREFTVKLKRNCFKGALKNLQLSGEEKKIVKKEREREFRKRNTNKTRKHQSEQNENEELELEELQDQREELIEQKKELLAEIDNYKLSYASYVSKH